MVIWPGLGINYGNNFTTGNYDTTLVESDLAFLQSQGVTHIRIYGPGYTNASGMFVNCQDMCLRAMSHGFYVVWGVSTGVGKPNLTATIWAAYKPVVTGTIATWAQANGLSELMIANECDYEADGTTLLASTVRSDVRAMAASVKAGGFTGVVSYDTAADNAVIIPAWFSEGLGSLDLIGWNNYNGSLLAFTNATNSIATKFGTKGYMSEFGSNGGGYPNFNDENLFASDTISRINAMQSAGVPLGYFFCYRDGANGVPANTFALVQTNNVARCVRGAILNTPGQPILGAFGVHA